MPETHFACIINLYGPGGPTRCIVQVEAIRSPEPGQACVNIVMCSCRSRRRAGALARSAGKSARDPQDNLACLHHESTTTAHTNLGILIYARYARSWRLRQGLTMSIAAQTRYLDEFACGREEGARHAVQPQVRFASENS